MKIAIISRVGKSGGTIEGWSDGVLGQSYRDFEFIIKDSSVSMLNK